jgi:uncharacterized protein (TIGR02246 family)
MFEEERNVKAFASLCSTAAIALVLTACNQAPPPPPDTHDADVKAISDLEVQWNKDYVAKDSDKIAGYYAGDAILMAPGMPPTTGADAIRGVIKQMLTDPALSLTFQTKKVDVAKSGDLAWTQGTYQMTMTDPATHKVINDHGSYVTTYRKQADGSWKAEDDIATSEVPPAPPTASKKHKG